MPSLHHTTLWQATHEPDEHVHIVPQKQTSGEAPMTVRNVQVLALAWSLADEYPAGIRWPAVVQPNLSYLPTRVSGKGLL